MYNISCGVKSFIETSPVLYYTHTHTGSTQRKNSYSPAVHPVLSSNSRNVGIPWPSMFVFVLFYSKPRSERLQQW